jgi:predicted esterase
MTKEDREEDINDYVRYLDDLLALYLEGRAQAPRIVVVGFSQGGATATRWVCQGNSNIDRLVLWAASFPQDLVFPNATEALNKVGLTLVIGDEDEFISSDHVEDLISKLNQRSISHSLVNFSGGHTIETDVLKTIVG